MTPLLTYINKAVVLKFICRPWWWQISWCFVLYSGGSQQSSLVSVNRRDFVVLKKCRLHILPNASLQNTTEQSWNNDRAEWETGSQPGPSGALGGFKNSLSKNKSLISFEIESSLEAVSFKGTSF